MKLNADILYDFLNPYLPLTYYGKGKPSLHLLRPEFYTGETNEFIANHLYISLADRLPDMPRFGNDVVIICVGGKPPVWYTTGRCVCLLVNEFSDLFTVFNYVQSIFNAFDSWERELYQIQRGNSDISAMIRLSTDVLGLSMTVLDRKFKNIATNELSLGNNGAENSSMTLDDFSRAMEHTKVDLTTQGPYLMELEPCAICSNLFDSHGIYIGSLTFHATQRELRPSDGVLNEFLADFVKKAIVAAPTIEAESRQDGLKAMFSELLQGLPCNQKRLHQLEEHNSSASFLCAKILPVGKLHAAPLKFVCDLAESSIPHAVAFAHEAHVVAFIEISAAEQVYGAIENFTNKVDAKIGISQVFSDLLLARSYYRQASVAIDFGSILHTENSCYRFSDYRLYYLLSHATGEFPLEIILPDGLRALYERDQQQNSNYIQTLQTYLDSNMNISKTASSLFLHRSSLIERLKRIERYLNLNLDDPEDRLQIQILLRTAELNEKLNLGF